MAELNFPNIIGSFQQGQALGRQFKAQDQEREKQSRLSQLAAQAYGANPNERSGYVQQAIGVDPDAGLALGGQLEQVDERRIKAVSTAARLLASAPHGAQESLYQNLRGKLQQQFPDMQLPPSYTPEAQEYVAAVNQAFTGPQDLSDRYRNVGNALIDLSGDPTKPIYQAPGSPIMTDQGLVRPTPNGLEVLTIGGEPQAPQGGQPFYSDVESVVSPLGGRITSTTGGQHNPGSAHPGGGAVDIGMGRETPEQQSQILAALQGNPNFVVRDERQRPQGQAVWSGPHLHVEPRAQPQGRRVGPPVNAAQQQQMELAREEAKRSERRLQLAEEEARQKLAGGRPALSAGEASKVRQQAKDQGDAIRTFKEFESMLAETPNLATSQLDPHQQGRLQTSYNNARAALRIVYNTGVLQPGELPMLESALANPTGWRAMDPRTRQLLAGQLEQLYVRAQGNIENLVNSYPQVFNREVYNANAPRPVGPQGAAPATGQQAGGPREVTTQAEFDALPSGAVYLEDGVQYRKP